MSLPYSFSIPRTREVGPPTTYGNLGYPYATLAGGGGDTTSPITIGDAPASKGGSYSIPLSTTGSLYGAHHVTYQTITPASLTTMTFVGGYTS